ncbi:MAG: single-stranded DNA-binding protein [Bacilli bacterium]|nr:single-stranded DNA-binding protein [Bacilli bacterium]
MLNQMMMVGRIVEEPKVQETENGNKVTNLTLAVPRSFKNKDGEYDTDFVDCVLWNNIAQNTAEYCKKGDLVGIRGRVETSLYKTDGKTQKSTKIVAEKVTFLTAKSKDSEKNVETKKTKSESKSR